MKIIGQRNFALAIVVVLSATVAGTVSPQARGQQPVGVARSQLRRTVDPSERSAYGDVRLRSDGVHETTEVIVKELGEDSFSIWFGPEPTVPITEEEFTNRFVRSVANLIRTNEKKGTWTRRLTGIGGAPGEWRRIVNDVAELAGSHLLIGKFGENDLQQGVTNIVGNTTNIIFGIPLPNLSATGNVLVTMWAPLPALSTKPSSLSYSFKGPLQPPAGSPPPSPGAYGTASVKLTGPTGRSVFDVQAHNLNRGQVYHVFISTNVVAVVDSNIVNAVLVDAGTMTANKSGSTFRFLRDTRFGDPLPQQARDAGDLAGRVLEIRDESIDYIHLIGIIPGPAPLN